MLIATGIIKVVEMATNQHWMWEGGRYGLAIDFLFCEVSQSFWPDCRLYYIHILPASNWFRKAIKKKQLTWMIIFVQANAVAKPPTVYPLCTFWRNTKRIWQSSLMSSKVVSLSWKAGDTHCMSWNLIQSGFWSSLIWNWSCSKGMWQIRNPDPDLPTCTVKEWTLNLSCIAKLIKS